MKQGDIMQWSARLYLKVKDRDVFKRLSDVSAFGMTGEKLFGGCVSEYVVDGDGGMTESELYSFVAQIAKKLGEDGIVIGDCTSVSVDPFTYCAFYLGDRIRSDCFEIGNGRSKRKVRLSEMFSHTRINKPHEWLTYAHFDVSDREKKVLSEFGITVLRSKEGNVFEYNSPNLGLPEEIALTGTQYDGRIDRIEKIKVGDVVVLVREPNSEWGENTIDVRISDGSIGYLDQDACDKLAPLIDSGMIKYTAAVARVVPLSKRSRHCKTAIVTVCVKASYL